MKVSYSVLRKQGRRVNVVYIDDSLIAETVILFTKHGFMIPKKEILFWGFWTDSEKNIVTLPNEKVEKLKKEITHLLNKKCKTIREVSRVLGLIISTLPAVELRNLFL